jgi:hypothetical protein
MPRYRQRFFIPYFSVPDGTQLGYLTWKNDGMEAHTADGILVGKYPTRRDAARALWQFLRQPKWSSLQPVDKFLKHRNYNTKSR